MTDDDVSFCRRNTILLISIVLLTIALAITIFDTVQEISNRPPDPVCVSGHYERRSDFMYINGTLISNYKNVFVCDLWEQK